MEKAVGPEPALGSRTGPGPWRCVAGGERAQWFGDQATLYMPVGGVHGPVQRIRDKGSGDWVNVHQRGT